ncbi:hypothetical protein UM89_02700 [Bacillus subtilis]|nr:hypothetical protein UM89_02700 [Bacillus subtilis]
MNNNHSRIDNLIEKFIDKYGTEEYYMKGLKDRFISWLDNTDKEEIKNILIELFSSFYFYTKNEIKEILYKQLTGILDNVDINYTSIVPLTKKKGSSSSFDAIGLLTELVREHDIQIYKETILMDISYVEDHIDTIVFFDDISGTGGTVQSFLKERYEYLKGRKIIINLICITSSAKQSIEKYLRETDLNVELIVEHEYDKAFSNHENLSKPHKEIICKFETDIWGTKHNNILGYKSSELLIGFSHNIPNNTISSFWYDPVFQGKMQNWNTLFKRFTRPTRTARTGLNSKKQRKRQNLTFKSSSFKGGKKVVDR